MKEFIAKFGDQINGILSGLDRLIFHGKLRALYNISVNLGVILMKSATSEVNFWYQKH